MRGFTLIELLTVIAIVAIAASLAAPSMASLIRANRATGEINALSAAIRVAKAEAAKRGGAVQMCASTDGSTCSGSSDWSRGWITFDDKNKNQTLDSDEAIIAKEQAFQAGDSLTGSDSTSAININSEGFAFSLPSAGRVVFTLQTTPADDQAQRCIVITQAANPTIQKKGGANCA